MSWKSFLSAGLLCVVASPVFAAPTVTFDKGGTEASNYLNADGDWVWLVRLHQSNPIVDIDDGGPITPGSPLAAELGFAVSGNGGFHPLLDADANTAEFDDPNPGNPFWGWENYSDTNGDTVIDSTPPTDDEPVGLQSNCAAAGCTESTPGDDPDTVFAALGSVDYGSDADGKDFITIVARGPSSEGTVTTTTSTITMSGAYGGNGRIAELNDAYDGDGTPPISLNYDTYAGAFTRSAILGDANLDGDVDGGDINLLLATFYVDTGRKWYHGNFDNQLNDDTNGNNLNILLAHLYDPPMDVGPGDTGPFPPPGAGGGGAVPEPATLSLLALAALGIAGLRRRHG